MSWRNPQPAVAASRHWRPFLLTALDLQGAILFVQRVPPEIHHACGSRSYPGGAVAREGCKEGYFRYCAQWGLWVKIDGWRGRREAWPCGLVRRLKIETNTWNGILAEAQREDEKTQNIPFIAPRQSVCITNVFYWPHIAAHGEKIAVPKQDYSTASSRLMTV